MHLTNFRCKTISAVIFSFALFTSLLAKAQPFAANEIGYVPGTKFAKLIKSRHYQLVGLYRQVYGKGLAASVVQNGHWMFIDEYAKETPNPNPPGKGEATPGDVKAVPDEKDDGDRYARNYVHPSNINLQVTNGIKKGLINSKTKSVIIPEVYDEIRLSTFSFVMVRDGAKWGMVSKQGVGLIAPTYEGVQSLGVFMKGEKHLTGDAVTVTINNKWGLISPEGLEVVYPRYDEITSSWSGIPLMFVRVGNKWGVINNQGRELVPPVYDVIDDFQKNGLARVGKVTDKIMMYGIIDTLGNEVLPPVYNNAYGFGNKLVITYTGKYTWASTIKFWNAKGENMPTPEYRAVGTPFQNLAVVTTKESNKGCIDSLAHEVLPPIYNELTILSNQFFLVKLNGKLGVIARDGTVIVPFGYEDILYDKALGLFRRTIHSKEVMFDFYNNQYPPAN